MSHFNKPTVPPVPDKIVDPWTEEYFNDLHGFQTRFLDKLSLTLLGLKIEDNFDMQMVTIADTGAANTDFPVAHTLHRVPNYFLIISNDTPGITYRGVTPWTQTQVYLRYTIANGNIKIMVW